MGSSIVEEVLKEKENLLRRHLVLSTTVIEKLHRRNVIGDLTMKHMMVCLQVYVTYTVTDKMSEFTECCVTYCRSVLLIFIDVR